MADLPSPDSQPPIDIAARQKALQFMQPFGRDICESWHDAEQEGHVPLNERTLDQLRALRAGERVLLIRAPRAGYGKTHLLGHAATLLKENFVPMTLPWQSPDAMNWTATGRGLLADLSRDDEKHNALWQICAGVCATLLRRLIQTGRIPSADPAQALQVLDQPPQEIFGGGSSAQVIGTWFREHFAQLIKPMAESANLGDLAEAEAWLRAMFEHMRQPSPATLGELFVLIARDPEAQTQRFLRLAASWKPVVLLADHMDAFYRNPESGVALAQMALSLASLPGVHVVMSLNQDLWETTFGPQLPSALEDRLNARSVALNGMTLPDAQALIKLRLDEATLTPEERASFNSFLDLERYFLGRPLNTVSPRALLRHAAAQWRIFSEHGIAFLPKPAPQAAPSIPPSLPGPVEEKEEPPPGPFLDDDADPVELQKLAESLEREAQGQQVDLSNGTNAPESPHHLSAIPPESFLAPEPPSLSHDPPSPTGLSESTQNSFQKLRQMLSRVRANADDIPASETPPFAPPPLMPHPLEAAGPPAAPAVSAEDLQRRYEELRAQFGFNGKSRHMDMAAVGDLVGIAGRRFAIVRYDEVDLPGLPGHSLTRWSLQGSEIVFGVHDFGDRSYWQTVSMFLAGRVAATQAAAQVGEPAPRLKLAVFKNDENAAQLSSLLHDNVIPPTLQPLVDAVHLDTRSLASIHAMREVVREADAGTLSADGSAVTQLMAQELDFLWKRLTRQE
jgi:hypothetical protein